MKVKNVPDISRKSTIAAEKRVSQDRVDSLNRAPYKHVHRRRRCGDVVPASFCCLMLVQNWRSEAAGLSGLFSSVL